MSETPAEPVSLAALFARRHQQAATAASAATATPAAPEFRIDEALAAAWQEGHAAASAECAPTVEALRASLAEAECRRDAEAREARDRMRQLASAIEARFAQELATLALAATETILKAPSPLSAATLESLIAEATGGLGGGTLFLAPDAVEHAQPLAPPGWAVAARDGLDPGMVEAEAGPALQRASLMGRLEQLLEAQP